MLALPCTGVEQIELTQLVTALRQVNAIAAVVAPKSAEIPGMNHQDKGHMVAVDYDLVSAKSDGFDALVLANTNRPKNRLSHGLKSLALSVG